MSLKNLEKMCLEIYQLDLAKPLSAPGLDSQAALKKTEVELGLLTDIGMLFMVWRRIRRRIFNSINKYFTYL